VERVSQDVLERRRNRFAEKSEPRTAELRVMEPHGSDEPIVGCCTRLEKAYFRLTTAPNPDEIRPEPVLKEAYKRLKSMWKTGGDIKYIKNSF
jgi:singapore isolate B (sub-type 7) whole genome shotgun sequence assembly, scaffold_2